MANIIVPGIVVPKAKEMGIQVVSSPEQVKAFMDAHQYSKRAAMALKSMMDGNARHVKGETVHGSDRDEIEAMRFATKGQKPLATVLSCADSRVKVSRIFDKQDGRIFGVKNAGNIAYSSETLGTIEYGVLHTHTPILMVLGHELCGAVSATCTHKGHLGDEEGHVVFIVEAIGRTAERVHFDKEATTLLNVFDVIESIRARSNIIHRLEKEEKVNLVPAYYSITSGQVAILDRE